MPPKSPATNTGLPIIPYASIEFTEQQLGEGGFGVVRKGKWQYTEVAVKQLKATQLSDEALEEFAEEAGHHARLRHPNVVTLFGVSLDPGRYCMVMELMVKGSLYDVLHNKQELPWSLRLSIAKDILAGLTYLHDQNILHRDIKSLNVLLNAQMRASFSDFGLSKVKTETMSMATSQGQRVVGTPAWMAPELFSRRPVYSRASDIYALAMLLWELASRERPYKDSRPEAIPTFVLQGEREDIPADTPKQVAHFILRCWAHKPEERPSAKALADEIMAMTSLETQQAGQTITPVIQQHVAVGLAQPGGENPAAVAQSGYLLFSEFPQALALQAKPAAAQANLAQKPPVQAFFQPPALEQAVAPLLLHVARGEQDEAEAILRAHPEYLLLSGTVTDYSNRTFINVTAFQYAVWALDVRYMTGMMLSCIPDNAQGQMLKEALAKQLQTHLSRGLTYTFNGKTITEKHYDFTPLTQALQTYVDNYQAWSSEQCQKHWCTVVGGAQRLVPAHVAQHYCEPNVPFEPAPSFQAPKFVRSLKFKNYATKNGREDFWWASDSTLGVDFASRRGGVGRGVGGAPRCGGAGRADLLALQALCKIRTSDLELLRRRLFSGPAELQQVDNRAGPGFY